MSETEIYRHADRELKRIFRRMGAEFQNHSLRAAWDDLNVIAITTAVDKLYSTLYEYLIGRYVVIARKAYRDAWDELFPGERPEDDLDYLFVAKVLDGYDTKMEYKYSSEWQRKRDRLKESMMSVGEASDAARIANTQRARQALKRARDLLERQVLEMADTMTDDARNEAFRDAGVEKVRWNTQQDSRVCRVCRERDGEVYDLDRLPPKHPRCRCYYTPINPNERS